MNETKYPVKMPQPPALITSFGQRYAVGGIWVKVPADTTFENLAQYAVYNPPEIKKPINKFHVSSTKSKNKYTVEVWENKITCNCSGYRWRNKCKHADAVKKSLKK
jgi:hypothetical protein